VKTASRIFISAAVLGQDRLVKNHLGALQDTMLEQNLQRLIEPFSCVEVTHVAKLIELPLSRVESKLAEMILDKKLSGTLDQGKGHLVLFDSTPQDKTYTSAVAAIAGLNGVVDSLFKRAEELK
jgi:26S proteasome regulatory subunit N6